MEQLSLDSIWERLADLTAEATRMTEAEAARFGKNPVAKLVGLLPFLASSDEPARTSLAHLAVWIMANRGGARAVFDHKPADDRNPLARLTPIAGFEGGDRRLIEEGLLRLRICMVAGYRRDLGKDRALDAYNPLASGAWNGEASIKALVDSSAANSLALAPGDRTLLDAILPVEEALRGWWDA
jgi:hypothetical protein